MIVYVPVTGRLSRLAAQAVPSAIQVVETNNEPSGLYAATLVLADAAGTRATPDTPSPRLSPAAPANVRRAASPGFAIATSAGAPSTCMAAPWRSESL